VRTGGDVGVGDAEACFWVSMKSGKCFDQSISAGLAGLDLVIMLVDV
jgi:hypothetical protein